MSGVIVGRGDFGQGWLWPGVIVAGVILGRGDFGQGWSRFRGDSGGVILAGWFWQGDFVRGDCGFIPLRLGNEKPIIDPVVSSQISLVGNES